MDLTEAVSDPVLDKFKDLLPGKREPVNRHTEPEQALPWDEKSTNFKYNGVDTEFFTIANVSLALQRAPVTIRAWENRGLLPKSPYRSPKPRRETIPGRSPKGKRLWTRDQIEGMLRIAREENVILNGKSPNQRFAARVAQLFTTLLEKDTAA